MDGGEGVSLVVSRGRVVAAGRWSGTPHKGVGIVWIVVWWGHQHNLDNTSQHNTSEEV